MPALLENSDEAHDEFETFAKRKLRTADGTDPGAVARYLVAENARSLLIEDYVYELARSSLQSAEEVQRTAKALGLGADKDLTQRVLDLKPMFSARNEISHELDLQRPEKQGDRSRRSRPMGATVDMSHKALEVAQQITNSVGLQLDS